MNEPTTPEGRPATPRFVLPIIIAATIAAAAWLLAFATGRLEIGVVGEWTWKRHDIVAVVDVAIPITITILLLTVYMFVVQRIAKKLSAAPERALNKLVLLALMGFGCLWAIQSCAPSPHRQFKPNFVLYDWGASGYFDEARKLRSLGEYLTGFEDEMRKGEVLHKGTHPPGLVIANYDLLIICRENSWATTAILSTIPPSVDDGFRKMFPADFLNESDRAALWLSVLLTQLLAALTVVPLYGLLRRSLDAEFSLLIAGLWPLVPGVAVFLPKSDALFPLLGCTFLFFALSAWDKGSIWRGLLAGVTFCIGMMVSLAMLPFAVVAAFHALVRLKSGRPPTAAMAKSIGSVLAGFALTTVAFASMTGIALWRTWVLNFQNHAGFYEKFRRTYSKWLLANPLELALTVGAPILVVALLSMVKAIRSRDSKLFATPIAVLVTWMLLWLSGKNMGEAARLWLLLTPLFLWTVAATFRAQDEKAKLAWKCLLACQATVAVLTVTVLSGFSF